MKYIVLSFVMLSLITDPTKIAQINALKSEAKKAYLSGDFKTAITKYKYLVDSLDVNEEEVLLNLANSYFQANDSTNAFTGFQQLSNSSQPHIRSKAQQQLGVMANRESKFEEALNHFKQAIKADPTNQDARYNYELLKKKLDEKKKQDQNQQNQDKKDQQNKEQQKNEEQKKENEKKDDQQKENEEKKDSENKNEEQKDQEQKDKEQQQKEQQQKEQEQKDSEEKKDIPPSVSEKLKEMEMSEEKARMILEAMKNQEIQYLQQNKRKATKPKDKGKPDW